MILKTTFMLISSLWIVHCQALETSQDVPVQLLDLKYVVIDGYHGNMNAKTLELFEKVETLAVQNCNFSTFNENAFYPLKNLQKLIIANNHFDREKDDLSTCCKNLRELEMYGCNMGTIEKTTQQKIASMPVLERFYLHRMDIPVLYSNALVGSTLRFIKIEYSNLATVEDGALNGLDKLEVLSLQSNKLEAVPTTALAAVKTLKELDLSKNLLEKVTAADLPLLPNLEKLNLGHNPIKQIDLKGLKEKLPNIKEVDVSGIDIEFSQAEGIPLIKLQVA